jgi:hypothetical protein
MSECTGVCTKYDTFLTSTSANGDTKWLEGVNAINSLGLWEYLGNCLPFTRKANLHRRIYLSNIAGKIKPSWWNSICVIYFLIIAVSDANFGQCNTWWFTVCLIAPYWLSSLLYHSHSPLPSFYHYVLFPWSPKTAHFVYRKLILSLSSSHIFLHCNAYLMVGCDLFLKTSWLIASSSFLIFHK